MVSACSLEDDLKTTTYRFSGEQYYFAANSIIILVYHVLLLLFCLIQEIEKSKCGKLWRPDGIVFIARSWFFLIYANYFSLILKSFFFHFEEPCLDVTWAQSPSYEAFFKNLRRTSGRSGHLHECHDLNMSHDSANVCVDANYLPSPDTFAGAFICVWCLPTYKRGPPRGLFVLMTFMESLRQLKMDTCFIDKQ